MAPDQPKEQHHEHVRYPPPDRRGACGSERRCDGEYDGIYPLYFFRQRQRPHFWRQRVRRGGRFRRCQGLQVTLTPARHDSGEAASVGGLVICRAGCEQAGALPCDGRHEMLDSGRCSEWLHHDAKSVEPPWPHRRCRSVCRFEWRKIMSNTSDELRELQDDEVDGVTGGLVVISIIGILIGQLLPAVNPPPALPKAS